MSDSTGGSDRPQDRRLDWGGAEDAPELTKEQADQLQQREEPIAHGDFGMALTGDLGRTDGLERAAAAQETTEPDTSLGHEGGQRYEDYAAGIREWAA